MFSIASRATWNKPLKRAHFSIFSDLSAVLHFLGVFPSYSSQELHLQTLSNTQQREDRQHEQSHLPTEVEGNTNTAGDRHERIEDWTNSVVDCRLDSWYIRCQTGRDFSWIFNFIFGIVWSLKYQANALDCRSRSHPFAWCCETPLISVASSIARQKLHRR